MWSVHTDSHEMASICVGSELAQTFCIFHPNFSLRLKVFSGDGEIWNELPTLCTSWDHWIITWHVMFVASHIFRTISYWLNIETCSLEMCQIWRFGDTRLSWHVTRDTWVTRPLTTDLNTVDMIRYIMINISNSIHLHWWSCLLWRRTFSSRNFHVAKTKVCKVFTISWLKAPTSTFTFKTPLWHYASVVKATP